MKTVTGTKLTVFKTHPRKPLGSSDPTARHNSPHLYPILT
jgi:hypothetical protein